MKSGWEKIVNVTLLAAVSQLLKISMLIISPLDLSHKAYNLLKNNGSRIYNLGAKEWQHTNECASDRNSFLQNSKDSIR